MAVVYQNDRGFTTDGRTNLGDHVCGLAEVATPPHGVGLGEVVLDQAQADVVAHIVQLLVHLHVVALVVLAQLGDDGSVGQDDELGVDLVDAPSFLAQVRVSARDWIGLDDGCVVGPVPKRPDLLPYSATRQRWVNNHEVAIPEVGNHG